MTALHPDHTTILAATREAAELIDAAHEAMIGHPMPGPTVAAVTAELERVAVGLAAHCEQLSRSLAMIGHPARRQLAVAEHLHAAERSARYAAAWIGQAAEAADHGQSLDLAA